MGLVDKLKSKAVDFLYGLMVKKGAKQAAQLLIAYILSLPLDSWGVSVKFEEAAVVAAIAGLLEMGRFVFLDCKRCKKQLPLFAALGELKAFCPCSGTLHILIKYKDEKDDFEVDDED